MYDAHVIYNLISRGAFCCSIKKQSLKLFGSNSDEVSSLMMLLFLCCATSLAQIPLNREPSSPTLVDERPGYRPLYQSSDETKRRNGSYIITLKDSIRTDDLGRLMARMTSASTTPNDSVVVQGLSGFSMVGLGVMATLNQAALDLVSTAMYIIINC